MNHFALLSTLVAGLSFGAQAAVQIESLDFQDKLGNSELMVKAPQPLEFTQTRNEADRQIVVDIQNATLGPNASRRLDTSSFNTPVSLISPYQLEEPADTVRIVIQFREALTDVVIAKQGTNLAVNVSKPNNQPIEGSVPMVGEVTREGSPPTGGGLDLPGGTMAQNETAPGIATDPRSNPIDQFLEDRETQRFRGTPITIKVREAQVRDVLRLIGETSGFNMVVGQNVDGSMSLSLEDVPWDQALDVVLQSMNLGAERNQNVLRIQTLTDLTREKEAQLRAEEAAQASAPKVTRIFPINYAQPTELQAILAQFGSTIASGDGAVQGVVANIAVNERTQSLVIQDTVENVQRMEKLIELLDVETPQILIEGRIIEASEEFSDVLNGTFGVTLGDGGEYLASFNGSDPTSSLLGDIGTDTGASNFGVSPDLGFIANNLRLQAFLNIQETESKINVIASPRLIVVNSRNAVITSTSPVPVPQVGPFGGTGITFENAPLTLNVTPTVTNDQRVRLVLNMERSIPRSVQGQTGVAQRNINTEVLVKSGSTLVLGGIYESTEQESESGVPYLREIPLIGWLFGFKQKSIDRRELFYFVTPRILNRETSGAAAATVNT